MITERQLEVVLSVVYEYIKNGETVGSRTVSRRYLTGRSSATIRNEMSDLEDLGFLKQTHASKTSASSSRLTPRPAGFRRRRATASTSTPCSGASTTPAPP